jgi:hypothetical protein
MCQKIINQFTHTYVSTNANFKWTFYMPNMPKQHPSNYFEVEVTHLARERTSKATADEGTLFFLAQLPGAQSYVMTDNHMANVDNRQILGFATIPAGAGTYAGGLAMSPVRFTLRDMPTNPFDVEMFVTNAQNDGTTLVPYNPISDDVNVTSRLFMIWTIKEISPECISCRN